MGWGWGALKTDREVEGGAICVIMAPRELLVAEC